MIYKLNKNQKINRLKCYINSLAIFITITLFLLLCIELASWIYLKFSEPKNKYENSISPEKMLLYTKIFPNYSPAEIHDIFNIQYKQTYEPWVEFRTMDIETPLTNVKGLIRSTPHPEFSLEKSKRQSVYFFGGSTMQGVHVGDEHTIPSQLTKLAAINRHEIKSINFGQPYFYLKQEAILFQSLILDGKKPNIAIFLDGLNDFLQPNSSYQGEPFFTPAMKWMLEQPYYGGKARIILETNFYKIISKSQKSLKFSDAVPENIMYLNYSTPQEIDPKELYKPLAKNYINYVKVTTLLCKSLDIKCYFFLQPTPFLHYDRSHDIIAAPENKPIFNKGYNLIKQELSRLDNFTSLDKVFESPSSPPYVDAVHYSPYGNKVIAEYIYEKIRK